MKRFLDSYLLFSTHLLYAVFIPGGLGLCLGSCLVNVWHSSQSGLPRADVLPHSTVSDEKNLCCLFCLSLVAWSRPCLLLSPLFMSCSSDTIITKNTQVLKALYIVFPTSPKHYLLFECEFDPFLDGFFIN